MSPQRIAGFALLVVGLVLFFVGLNASHSFADQLSNTFTGKFTDSTAYYIYGGLAAAIVGGDQRRPEGRAASAAISEQGLYGEDHNHLTFDQHGVTNPSGRAPSGEP